MKKVLQIFKSATLVVTALLGLTNFANAQCAGGEVAVSFDIDTDAYGYEFYWELVPTGNACGTGTIFAGGNPAVGCSGGGAQLSPAGGYGNNVIVTEGPFCLTIGSQYDIIMVDDWGDGGNRITSLSQSVDVLMAGANQTITFTAQSPIAEDIQALATVGAEYTRVPLTQVVAVPLTAQVRNNGTVNVTDAVVTVSVFDLNTPALIQTTSSSATAVASGAVVTLSAGSYLPTAAGDYGFVYVVSSATITDADATNDTLFYQLSVGSDGMYARDNGDVVVNLGLNAPSAGILGNVFDVNVTGQMDSVFFFAGVTIGDSTVVSVYNVAGGVPTTQVGKSAYHICTAADTAGLITLPVTDMAGAALVLAPGKYFVGIWDSYTGFLGLGFTSGIYTLGGSIGRVNTGAWTDMAGLGFPNAAVVRPFINDVSTSVSETTVIGSISVYPNPTTGIFTISNTNSEVVNYSVTTIEGKVVKQMNNVSSNVINVDLSNENNGIYFLSVNGENTNSVFKIVKQ